MVSRSKSLSFYCPQTDKRYYVCANNFYEDISDDEADINMDGVVCDRVYVISKQYEMYVQIDESLFELPILDFRENLVAYRKSPSEIRIIDFARKKVYSLPCLREEHNISITAEFTFLEVLRKKCVLVIRNEEAIPNDFERTLLDAATKGK